MSKHPCNPEAILVAEVRDQPTKPSSRRELQMDDVTKAAVDSEELRFKELIAVLWSGRRLIASLTLACIVAAGLAAWLLPKTYEASITVAPVSASGGLLGGGNGLGSIGSELGGLAAIAGLSVGGDSRKFESLSVLESAALTEEYIRKNNLLPVLFYSKWDAGHQRWKDSAPRSVPTLWKANQLFKKQVRSVSTDPKTGIITVTISWRDPVLAANWANGIVNLTNDYLRNNAIAEDERNIAYLQMRAEKSNVVELKQAIDAVMVQEIKREMFAQGTREFAFKVLDPAEVPEKAASPKKVLWLLGGAFGGLLLSGLIVLGRFVAI
jgi:capsular polysaccharide biosynthesis protein